MKAVLILIIATVIAGGVAVGAPNYTAVILNPQGYFNSEAWGIANGQVVGAGNNRSHALVWDLATGGVVDLGSGIAYATNGAQQVGNTSDGASLWSGTAASRVSLEPGGAGSSYAFGIGPGQQVGMVGGDALHATLWTGSAASAVDLNPQGFIRSEAWATNGSVQVGIGTIRGENGGEFRRALKWSGSAQSAVDLTPAGYLGSIAYALSGSKVWGAITDSNARTRPVLWNGTADDYVDMTPTNLIGYAAFDVQGASSGFQVGGAGATGGDHALLWHGSADNVLDLHQFLPAGYFNSIAYGVDDRGNVVGEADGKAVVWLVPEPGGIAIVLGLFALSSRRSRVRTARLC